MLPLDSDSWFAAGALLSPREEADLDFDDVQEADPGCEADAWEPSSFRRLSCSLPLKEDLDGLRELPSSSRLESGDVGTFSWGLLFSAPSVE
jgi:hypothetical protein